MYHIVKAQVNEDGSVKVDKVIEKIGQFFPAVLPVVTADDIANLKEEGVISLLNVAVDEIFQSKVDDLEKKAKVCVSFVDMCKLEMYMLFRF